MHNIEDMLNSFITMLDDFGMVGCYENDVV